MHTLLKYFASAILVFLLSSCATMESPHSNAPLNQTLSWEERKQSLLKIHCWHTEGLLTLATRHESISPTFQWTQQEAQYHLLLLGPLGTGATSLNGDSHHVTLKTAAGVFTARSPEALLKRQLGWTLPVSQLANWVRGLPAPSLPAKMTFDGYHHIVQLTQAGWTIHYLAYSGVKQNDLPSKLFLKRPGLRLRLIMDQWKIF